MTTQFQSTDFSLNRFLSHSHLTFQLTEFQLTLPERRREKDKSHKMRENV